MISHKFSGLLGLIFLLLSQWTFAQNTQKVTVFKIDQPIVLDGLIDEDVWKKAESAQNFYQYFPTDSLRAAYDTKISFLYDDANLYIALDVTTPGDNYVIPSLKRDYRAGNNDNISLVFDTFNDGINAYLFGVNPLGVMREALIAGGGNDLRNFTTSWDVKWRSEIHLKEKGYYGEIIIPLNSLKFKPGSQVWRFNSYRFDMQSGETTTWANIPQNQQIFGLAFMGDLVFEHPLGQSRTPLAIVPFVNGIAEKGADFGRGQTVSVGADAKIPLGNSMNLDLTYRPDFSNVEIDDQVTNLTRFELLMPERRQFFIDNNDLFGNYGNSQDVNPFFSRRIGLAKDQDGNTIENKINAGARFSGNLSNGWRLGLLHIQTEADQENEISGNNNSVFALQKQVFARSSISLIAVQRATISGDEFTEEADRYNRVIGLDYNLASEDNKWTGKFYYIHTDSPEIGPHSGAAGGNLEYLTKNFGAGLRVSYVGEDYRADLGFTRRYDFLVVRPYIQYNIWPQKGAFNRHEIRFSPNKLWRPGMDYQNTDRNTSLSWEASMNDLSKWQIRATQRYTYLTDSFNPTRNDENLPIPAQTCHTYTEVELEYQSDPRKSLFYTLTPSSGEFYNGWRNALQARISLRMQPKTTISVQTEYNQLLFPQPFADATLFFISPKLDYTFSKSVFWSATAQYNNSGDYLGVNARLQWRFAPLSDLFVVYNDQYQWTDWLPKYRSINLKLSYWLNI